MRRSIFRMVHVLPEATRRRSLSHQLRTMMEFRLKPISASVLQTFMADRSPMLLPGNIYYHLTFNPVTDLT